MADGPEVPDWKTSEDDGEARLSHSDGSELRVEFAGDSMGQRLQRAKTKASVIRAVLIAKVVLERASLKDGLYLGRAMNANRKGRIPGTTSRRSIRVKVSIRKWICKT